MPWKIEYAAFHAFVAEIMKSLLWQQKKVVKLKD